MIQALGQDNFNKLAQLSPKSELSQLIGITNIDITYYRPDADGRQIWGKQVPYGEVWRAGANFTTTIAFDTDVEINNGPLKAGKYALFLLPTEEKWTLIFDSNLRQFGSFFYTGTTDALRVDVEPFEVSHFETAIFYFEDLEFNSGDLVLAWTNKAIRLTIMTDRQQIINYTRELAKTAIEENNQQDMANCIAWAIDNKLLIDEAKGWLKASQSIKPDFPNQFLEARFYAYEGNYEQAIEQARKVAEQFPFYEPVTRSFITRWELLK